MRRAAKVDRNHGEIRDAFRQCGCLVESLAPLGRGVPDLLVDVRGRIILVEVKTTRGRLTEAQAAWMKRGWAVSVVRSVEDVRRLVARQTVMAYLDGKRG